MLGASAFIGMPSAVYSKADYDINELINKSARPVSGGMFGFKVPPIKNVRVGIIGLGNRGQSLIEMFPFLLDNGSAEIVALCDLKEEKVQEAESRVAKYQKSKKKLRTFFGGTEEWKKLADLDEIDLLLICTPWEWHTPMCIYGMEMGKHVASEVPIAYTLDDCWSLVETSEHTQKHCIMLENCCYNEEELFVLNMIENGVFGDITHTEGAYLHDLRAHMLSSDYYEDQWRLKHHINRDGNFYTTHGLGPIAFYLGIGRGDTFDHMTSMSSRELNLSETAERVDSPYTSFACGDLNTTLIKTAKGKSIMLQFDVHTGRPYSRINKVVGTKAVHDGYPSRLYIDKEELAYWGHQWLEPEEYEQYKEDFRHPIIQKLKRISEDYKQGHGGMDFVMIYRLITSLNLGLALDINVYDSVMWSAITPLSEASVASNSASISVPDFTNGIWKKEHPLEIMTTLETQP